MKKPTLEGFSHINRFWSPTDHKVMAKIGPGEFYVTRHDEVLSSILGSCIAVCIFDPVKKIGGMNHFMLPFCKSAKMQVIDDTFRFGDQAMEILINAICENGGVKHRLVYKAFGGGHMLNKMTPIGESNMRFLKQFMRLEKIELTSADLGGPHPRLIKFFPLSGKVEVKRLEQLDRHEVAQKDEVMLNKVEASTKCSDQSELFG